MQFTAERGGIHALRAVLMLVLASGGQVQAQELADLKVDSKAREYHEKNPVQVAKQEFSLSKAGMVTLLYVTDPYHKDIKGGYIPLEEVNGRNFVIGPGIYQKRTPETGIPGQL